MGGVLLRKVFIAISLCTTMSTCGSFWEIISRFIAQYSRPITILYISHCPVKLPTDKRDVVVVWGDAHYKNTLKQKGYANYILVTTPFNSKNLINLAECEHFDLAIIDTQVDIHLIQHKAHLADYTMLLPQNKELADLDECDITFLHKPKKVLLRNWWKSTSITHNNYPIVSTFQEKFFSKSKQHLENIKNEIHVNEKLRKKYHWMPGINLYTYIHMLGLYPCKNYVREKILEIFNPLIHKDFGAANILIQGTRLKAIDYDDSIYPVDPYERLKSTLEYQLGIPYKKEQTCIKVD